MPIFELETSSWVSRNRPDVFAFFSNAENLEGLTPPFLHFSIVTPRPVTMRAGQLIDYQLYLHGLRMKWQTEITRWESPACFEDTQRRGPYRLWVHTHTFEESDGGTLVRDRVKYSVPGGRLVHSLLVRRELRRIFEYRQKRLPELLGLAVSDCRLSDVTIRRAQLI